MSRRHSSNLRRSQNFLNDPGLIEHLVDLADIELSDVVYDLGAGSGNLTAALARRAGQVIAIEKDPVFATQLRKRFRRHRKVFVHERDLRGYSLPHSDYVVLANPPFDITASVVHALTSAPVPPSSSACTSAALHSSATTRSCIEISWSRAFQRGDPRWPNRWRTSWVVARAPG